MSAPSKRNPAPGYATHPDHTVSIQPYEGHVRVTCGDTELAASDDALLVEETGYSPVFYIPRGDVAMQALNRFVRRTHCPFKGDASYWALGASTETEPVAWSYDTPYDEALALEGHIAFYAERVTIERD